MGEGFDAAEGGEQGGEEGWEERVLGPVRGVGDFREEGFKGSELGAKDLPSGGKAGDGGEKVVEELRYLIKSFRRGGWWRRWRDGGGMHFTFVMFMNY